MWDLKNSASLLIDVRLCVFISQQMNHLSQRNIPELQRESESNVLQAQNNQIASVCFSQYL